ncbi:Aerobic C4-dicarboxylate transport protein [Thalassoglobus neptunius]|uniref:Aerobic C4-dicarboxylate transport protein n=1 Tax=Thalassoglobus neptunius TaxID=1938619 RepID=A0A5C5WBN8_9PLAN|nr:dicarboxylate/amino acid:cation symporter [Thalassoglobus neptunius]TWT47042.1 Aerobic C4-dicarboxylate transport protein [Thalassoglobus neptunius]
MSNESTASKSILGRWNAIPLYLRILISMGIGLVVGLLMGERAIIFEIPSQVILKLLAALAPPLILIAVTHVLMTTEISSNKAVRLAGLLILNTTVAILIGLSVANLMQPGARSEEEQSAQVTLEEDHAQKSPLELLISNIPKSLLGPLGDKQNVIGIIIIAVAFGTALRSYRDRPIVNIVDLVEIAYEVLLKVLHWIIQLVPIGVFAVVATTVGVKGLGELLKMGNFVVAVLVALALQAVWYLLRIQFFSWVKPFDAIRGVRDAMIMAFSTDSSTATMPVTYANLKENVGVSEESASLGALVGANFNNDGTALYEAMAALFIAQLIGNDLSIAQQATVVLTSIIASVGASGIPEAGLVTMALVFSAVGLPISYIPLLLTVDWFLDRCRTTINVLGDVNVACLLDGRTKPPADHTGIDSSNGDEDSDSLSDSQSANQIPIAPDSNPQSEQ